MRDLYPEIQPYNTLQLAVDDVHTLYVEEVGNPDGVPALFLHGGPGAGCEPYHRRFLTLTDTAWCCSINGAPGARRRMPI